MACQGNKRRMSAAVLHANGKDKSISPGSPVQLNEKKGSKFLLCVASPPIYMIMTPTQHHENNLTSPLLLFFSSVGKLRVFVYA